jgi:hypothetical protein
VVTIKQHSNRLQSFYSFASIKTGQPKTVTSTASKALFLALGIKGSKDLAAFKTRLAGARG